MTTKDLLTVQQASAEFGVPDHAITRALRLKQFEATRIGHSWVFTRKDFLTWLATRKKPGRPRKTQP